MNLAGFHNRGEFFSHHYLDAVLEGDLRSQFKEWKKAEEEGGAKQPFKALKALANPYFKALKDCSTERDTEVRARIARDFSCPPSRSPGVRLRPNGGWPG